MREAWKKITLSDERSVFRDERWFQACSGEQRRLISAVAGNRGVYVFSAFQPTMNF